MQKSSNSVSNLNCFYVCVHTFDEHGTTRAPRKRACLSSCRLTGSCASSLPARLSIETALASTTNDSCVKSPLGPLRQSPARVRVPAQFGWNRWKIIIASDTGRVGRLNSAGRSQVLRLRARLLQCWRCYSGAEQLKPSTVDDVLFLNSNHQIV